MPPGGALTGEGGPIMGDGTVGAGGFEIISSFTRSGDVNDASVMVGEGAATFCVAPISEPMPGAALGSYGLSSASLLAVGPTGGDCPMMLVDDCAGLTGFNGGIGPLLASEGGGPSGDDGGGGIGLGAALGGGGPSDDAIRWSGDAGMLLSGVKAD